MICQVRNQEQGVVRQAQGLSSELVDLQGTQAVTPEATAFQVTAQAKSTMVTSATAVVLASQALGPPATWEMATTATESALATARYTQATTTQDTSQDTALDTSQDTALRTPVPLDLEPAVSDQVSANVPKASGTLEVLEVQVPLLQLPLLAGSDVWMSPWIEPHVC